MLHFKIKIKIKIKIKGEAVRLRRGFFASIVMVSVCVVGSATAQPLTAAAEAPRPVGDEYRAFMDPPEVPDRLVSLAARAAGLVDDLESDFQGSFYDEDLDSVVITAVTERGVQIAEKAFRSRSVVIDRADVSGAEIGRDLEALVMSESDGIDAAWAAFDPAQRRVILGATGAPSVAETRGVSVGSGLPVIVVPGQTRASKASSRLNDLSPYAGGARFGFGPPNNASNVSFPCTGGFGYKEGGKEFVLTAGHCVPYGTNETRMWTIAGGVNSNTKNQYAGNFNNRSTWLEGLGTRVTNDGQRHGDLALVNVSGAGRAVGHNIWVGASNTTTKLPVVLREAPAIGTKVCRSGFKSGTHCGLRTYAINTVFTYDDGEVARKVDLAVNDNGQSGCGMHGDSGGPVFRQIPSVPASLVGIGVYSGWWIQGPSGSWPQGFCVMVFTGVEEARQAWGGDLDFQ